MLKIIFSILFRFLVNVVFYGFFLIVIFRALEWMPPTGVPAATALSGAFATSVLIKLYYGLQEA